MLEIIHDPYFYLDGEDILNLLKSKSNNLDNIIQNIIENECKYLCKTAGYQLAALTKSQVDKNQMTTVKIYHFLYALLKNKCEDHYDYKSPI